MTRLRARALSRTYITASADVHALVDVDLEVRDGELLVVRGPSGSGKTTLLNLLGGLDRPSSGAVYLDETELSTLAEKDALRLRQATLAFVFQSFGLVPVLSAAENVEVPLRVQRVPSREREERVALALEAVGLGPHAQQRPYELSGGQQQRVGIARALVTNPQVLIADEPTGQLDSVTAATIMDLIAELTSERGIAAVVSTHDPLLIGRADRVVHLHNGQLTTEAPTRDARQHGRHAAQG
ncbi:ABC transporter ATP-binding protein [Ruania halotolerans]|uniref:ABC transporter ATP-binding protein n=1 Tax=Ruania halotolerans TaxID=2897773 RepID=UPI001E4FA0BC|nr:ABC transporter ATP-binding protein [Ruania halotolerans]UFU07791.1 ABC transporter ATP-binding protein [Ruania halotolerans]